MGNGFQSQWSCIYKDISQQMNWYHLLPQIILDNKEPIYVLFEDTVDYQQNIGFMKCIFQNSL